MGKKVYVFNNWVLYEFEKVLKKCILLQICEILSSRLQSKTVWLKLYDHRESVMHVFWVCANFSRGG